MLIVPASIGLFGDGFPSTTTTASVIKSALMFDGSNDRLQLKFDEAGNTAEWTLSVWAKRAETSDASVVIEARADGNNTGTLYFNTTDIHWQDYDDGVGTPAWRLNSDNMYRDTTAWMHIVLVNDTGNGTAGNRQRIYVNGTRVTSFSTETNSGQGYESAQGINSTNPHYIGFDGNAEDYSGYLAEFIFLDGVATTDAGSFGVNDDNGVWVPKDPASTDNIADWGGKNSFWLKFDDGDNIGKNSRPTTVSAAAGTYKIDKSLMLDGTADYLSRTPSSAGSTTKCTYSFWVKRSGLGDAELDILNCETHTDGQRDGISFGDGSTADLLSVRFNDANDGHLKTNALFRDATAWQHLVVAIDTTQGVASNRVKIYNNGVQVTSFATETYPAKDYAMQGFMQDEKQHIGTTVAANNYWFDGYLAEFIGLDGYTGSASDFGGWDTNGNWVPIDPATTVAANVGTNGFHLKFDASGLLGKSSISSTNPSVSHLGSSTNGSTSTAYTFSSSSLGDAASNRTIVIAVGGGRATAGTRTVNSVTVGGSSATFIARQNSGAGNVLEFWSIAVASGTSADIVVTFSASMATVGISWWRVLDAGNPISTNGNTASGWTTQSVTTIGQTGDVAFYAIFDEGNADAYAWSDATERSEHIDITSTRSFTSADYTFDAAESHAETATISGGSGNDNGFLGVTFSNNNSFASNSLAAANQVIDSPTNTAGDNEGNYATLSPIDQVQGASVLSNGNLTIVGTGSNHSSTRSTLQTDGSGKFAWEVTVTTHDTNTVIGLMKSSDRTSGGDNIGATANSGWALVNDPGSTTNARSRFAGSDMVTDLGFQLTNGDVFHFELNNSTGDVFAWRKPSGGSFATVNSGNTITAGAGKTALAGTPVLFAQHTYQAAATNSQTYNFGQTTFEQTPSSGYKAVNTANLAAPTVTDPRAHYANAVYTGTAQSKTVRSCFDSTGTAWTPDFVWIKCRSDAGEHVLVDSIRGAANVLTPDSTAAEFHDIKAVTSLIEGGFTLGAGDDRNDSNDNAKTYVAWCMKAGGSGSSNSDGDIASTVSVASHGGFSIVKYDPGSGGSPGDTVGHGLSRAPNLIILKVLEAVGDQNWSVGSDDVGWTNNLFLNLTLDASAGTGAWNNTAPTSSVFTIGSDRDNNAAYIAYCFAKTPGLIGIGSYTGNGASDGPMVTIDDGASGFRPAWLMIKEYDGSNNGNWFIRDSARNPYNPTDLDLMANSTDDEYTDSNSDIDFTANGFKIKANAGGYNESGAKNLYIAFADQPFNLARAR